jgi:HPt (histidine-containing phosphotransfer) domain-containing protein
LPAAAIPLTEPESLSGLSLRRGLAIWRDAKVYQQYLRKFVRDYGAFSSDIRPLPLAARQALAHKLRGAAGNLALDQVAATAADLDERLKLNQDLGDTLQSVQQAIDLASAAIAHYAAAEFEWLAPPPDATDRGMLARLLAQALQLLAADTPEGMEEVLSALQALLPAEQLVPLRHAVEGFDFRTAEAAVLALARAQQLSLEDMP